MVPAMKCSLNKESGERRAAYMDSGCGQCLMTMGDMYSNISRCVIEIEGVAGTMMIYGIGTASILIVAEDKQQYVGIPTQTVSVGLGKRISLLVNN